MPKVRKCRVRACFNNSNDVRLYGLPKDPAINRMWRDNMMIPLTQALPLSNSFVCEKHFEEGAVGSKMLKSGAIPTLALGYDEPPPHTWTAPKLKRSCCVESCVSDLKQILYAFPRSADARKSWAMACKIEEPSSTDRLFVCQRHFALEFVTKQKLLDGAFPCFNLEPVARSRSPSTCSEWVCPPVSKVYTKVVKDERQDDLTLEEFEEYSILEERRQANEGSDVCDDFYTTTDRERFAQAARYYQSNAIKLNKKIKELEIENERLKQKYVNLISRSIIAEESASVDAITFAKMIVRTTKSPYSEEEKTLAQNINYMSSKAYSFMRDDLGFSLPHRSSLLRWRPIRYVVPGFDANVIKNLSTIVKKMSDTERICVLLFDEINIKPDLTYNTVRDCIDGYVDHGEGQREMDIGSKCCFFMVKGLCSKWKYVFSYYISKTGINATALLPIINKNISSLKSLGLNVKALICDQGGTNVGVFSRLNITEQHPYAIHENEKLFCMYDYCHLIKSIRNTLLNYNIPTKDGIANFRVIEEVFKYDQSNAHFKICPKLTETHLYPRSMEKMSVSRATQLLSNSVASGIEIVFSKDQKNKDQYVVNCAKSTQMFVKKMNDLFDDLDCKYFQTKNPLKCPLKRGDTEKVRRLNSYLDFLRSFKLPNSARVQCINGFCITIISMLKLSEELFERYQNLKFVSLGKLNQDALENFFYRIRASQGINTHPSAHDVQYIVARLISMKILRQKFENTGTNCEDDDDIALDWNLGPEDRHLGEDVTEDPQCEQLVLEEITIPDEDFAEDQEKAEVQVQRYFTGYGIYQKVLCKIKCEKCTTIMMKTQGDLEHYSEALIKAKNYTEDTDLRLVNPENRVFEVCRLQMMWYRQLFAKYAHVAGVRHLMLSKIREKTEEVFPEWFLVSGECREHRVKLLEFLITVLLFKNAKWLLRSEIDATRNKKCEAKLKKLENLVGRGRTK